VKDGAADIPEPLLSALQALIDAGQKIEAIKRYRFASGADLATAKGVVDALAAGRPRQAGAATSPAWNWQTQTIIPFTLAKLIGALRLVAWFCWLCGLIAAIAAGWQAYDRETVRTTWAQATAEVVQCRAVERSSSKRRFDLWTLSELPRNTYLVCAYRYTALGRAYTAEARSHSTDKAPLVAAMHAWVTEHPPGQPQSVYYDPADPQSISLGDADAGYEPDTPERRLQLTLLFGVVGTLFFGGGLWLTAVQQRRDASSGGA
jgi:hypothetical protein